VGRTLNNSEDFDKCELTDGSYMLQQVRVKPGLGDCKRPRLDGLGVCRDSSCLQVIPEVSQAVQHFILMARAMASGLQL
jgi:hypothetical protein